MAYYGGLKGILTGLTKSTDHPSTDMFFHQAWGFRAWARGAYPNESGRLGTIRPYEGAQALLDTSSQLQSPLHQPGMESQTCLKGALTHFKQAELLWVGSSGTLEGYTTLG